MSQPHETQRTEPRPGVAADNYLAGKREVRNVLAFGVILVIALAVVLLGMWILFGAFTRQHELAQPPVGPFHTAGQLPPEPRVRPDEVAVLRRSRQHEREVLETYGWVDRPTGVVRVPIDQAMEMWLKQQGVSGPTAREAKP